MTLSTDSTVWLMLQLLLRQSVSKTTQASGSMEKLQIRYIHMVDKLYKRFKLTKLYVDEEIYKEAQNVVQNLIQKKKKAYSEEKLKENTKNLKKLRKTSKQLGLPDKRSPSTNICLDAKNGLTFEPFTISEVFKKSFSNLANHLVQKLLVAAKKIHKESVEDYNNGFNLNPLKD